MRYATAEAHRGRIDAKQEKQEMPRLALTEVAAAVLLVIASGAPAWAGYGAIAYGQDDGKIGASWNQPTQSRAFEEALRQCASRDCRVHAVQPRGCGALALSDRDKAWGGADRVTLAAAKRAAVQHCQTHTAAGICTVRVFGCNK
jgi:Domain of unknown function (DUF4189)